MSRWRQLRTSYQSKPVAIVMLLMGALLLGLGWVAPAMTIDPGFGQWQWLVEALKPSMTEATTFSIMDGIQMLWAHDNKGIALLLFGFSIVFPALKLMAAAHAAMAWQRTWASKVASVLGKFSMLDVLVIACLVVAIKGLPGDSQVHLGWGLWSFAASVVISLLTPPPPIETN